MNMTDRQAKASMLIAIGLILLISTEPLAQALAGTAPMLLMAGIHSLSPVGAVVLIIGIYRAATKGKQSLSVPAAPPRMKPPSAVVASLCLFVLSFALGVMHVILTGSRYSSVGIVAGTLVSSTIFFFIARALYRGVNWVRWLLVVFTILGVIYLPWSFRALPVFWEQVVCVAQWSLRVIAAALLLTPTANMWYAPKPLLGSA